MNGRNGGVGARPLTVGAGASRSAGRGENDPWGGGLVPQASAQQTEIQMVTYENVCGPMGIHGLEHTHISLLYQLREPERKDTPAAT